MRMNSTHTHDRRAFTIVELLVVVSIIALLIALLLPAVQKGRDKALVSQSVGNLKNLASANELYAADWGDRQFTACPDDAGLVQGNCTTYLQTIAILNKSTLHGVAKCTEPLNELNIKSDAISLRGNLKSTKPSWRVKQLNLWSFSYPFVRNRNHSGNPCSRLCNIIRTFINLVVTRDLPYFTARPV